MPSDGFLSREGIGGFGFAAAGIGGFCASSDGFCAGRLPDMEVTALFDGFAALLTGGGAPDGFVTRRSMEGESEGVTVEDPPVLFVALVGGFFRTSSCAGVFSDGFATVAKLGALFDGFRSRLARAAVKAAIWARSGAL